MDVTDSVRATEALRAREQQTKLLLQEVSHRAKNMLAVIQAIIRQTSRELSPEIFAARIAARLASLAASHDLLVRSEWESVDLRDLVTAQLAHWTDLIGTRITIGGGPSGLRPAAAQTLGMAIHELATNASKYGALSNERGAVELNWRFTGNAGEARFEMTWAEHGGPAVAYPEQRGFGHTVIVRMVEHALDAEVGLRYPPDGLVWHISAPAEHVVVSPVHPEARTGEP